MKLNSSANRAKRIALRQNYQNIPIEHYEPRDQKRDPSRVTPELAEVISDQSLNSLTQEMELLAKMESKKFIPDDDDEEYFDKLAKRARGISSQRDLITKIVRQATAADLNEPGHMTMLEKRKSREHQDKVTKAVDAKVKHLTSGITAERKDGE